MSEELTPPCIWKIPGETGLSPGLDSVSGQLQGIMGRPMVCVVNVQSVERILFSIFNRFNVDFASPPAVSYTEKITSPVNHTPIMV